MKIIVTGSSGLIGAALLAAFRTRGREVVPLIRSAIPTPGIPSWDPATGRIDPQVFSNADAVIHLSGDNLAHGRWTAAKKRRIFDSRVQTTALLAKALSHLNPRPRVFICASGAGYYGDRGDEILTEDSPPGDGFIADLCQKWEQAAAPAQSAGIRTLHLRTGAVLTPAGGALKKMLTPFRLGLGGPIGDGRQYLPWITLADLTAAIIHLLDRSELFGPINFAAPESVTNRQFTQTLARILHRPAIFPFPAFAAKLLFGEMANEILLASERLHPKRLQSDGFVFQHPTLQAALLHALGRNP